MSTSWRAKAVMSFPDPASRPGWRQRGASPPWARAWMRTGWGGACSPCPREAAAMRSGSPSRPPTRSLCRTISATRTPWRSGSTAWSRPSAWIAPMWRWGSACWCGGAGGGIGLMATQLAARLTDDVTATTSSEERGRQLTALGATRLWNRRADAALEPGSFDVIVDAVGGPDLPDHIGLLRANGRYGQGGGLEGAPPPNY